MKAGIDFPSLFIKDNFTSRRTTGRNLYDPECLMTGAENAAGYTHTNSTREWKDQAHYLNACLGNLTPDQITETAPRVFLLTISHSVSIIASYYEEEAA
jgi:hypothetical protein